VRRATRLFRQGIFGADPRTILLSILLAVGVYVASLGYTPLNHGPYRLFLRTPLDSAMPLVREFVVPYISLQPAIYISLLVFLVFRVRVFQSAALSLIAAFAVSYVFFYFLQTFVERPPVAGADWFSRAVRDVYAGDNPYNDFPSLHVSLSAIIALHWARVGRLPGWAWKAWAALVIISTQLIHQHYLLDVAGGLVVAISVSHFFLHRVAERRDVRQRRVNSIADRRTA
jgi:membrane-associated phospholipid phosphatase